MSSFICERQEDFTALHIHATLYQLAMTKLTIVGFKKKLIFTKEISELLCKPKMREKLKENVLFFIATFATRRIFRGKIKSWISSRTGCQHVASDDYSKTRLCFSQNFSFS